MQEMLNTLFGVSLGGWVESEKMEQYRYRLALEGNDCPSSLPFDLLSGAVTLIPTMRWECKWHLGLRAWDHYIPLESGLGDLEAKMEWCETNPVWCEAIASRGSAHILRWHSSFGRELDVRSRILSALAGGYGACSARADT